MTDKDAPRQLPEFVLDKLGQEVRPGDRIVYGSGRGDLSEGIVLNFQYSSKGVTMWNYETGTWYDGPLKLKISTPNEQKVTIEATRKHFAKVLHKEEIHGN
jgi:hypothetical protein